MTVFAKIIAGELPCDKVYEDEHLIAFHDMYPQAPVHILIVPKEEFRCLQEVPDSKMGIIVEIAKLAKKIAKEFNVEDGYRLITNNGAKAGQTVFHLHFHLIGGSELREKMA